MNPERPHRDADIGVIGLAVMGQNLVLNMLDHGFDVAVFNRSPSRTEAFVRREVDSERLTGTYDVESFVAAIARPRRIVLMIKAGAPVDAQIELLLPHLDPGDVLIDGGNSLFTDTARRVDRLSGAGIHFVGAGISGGEEGARYGPSIMPGGDAAAWPIIEDVLTAIAATAGSEPMAAWVGPGGSGHFVKMVHNGIEYGDMQVIAEAYDIMSRGLDIDPGEQAEHFARWNEGTLESYLIEITAAILSHTEPDGTPTVDHILDAAGQKGTGRWSVMASMDISVPLTLVGESVYARMVSSLTDERAFASSVIGGTVDPITDPPGGVIDDLHDALYASKIVSYAQGFMLMSAASREYDWHLDLGTISGLWRAGCIIRSRFLDDITAAYRANPTIANLLLDDYFTAAVQQALPGLRRTVARAALAGIPTPAYASALAFLDAYRSKRLPADLIQAQRDFFGAHTYERLDRPRGEWFHTNWTGSGGSVTSESYSA
jgi:6-phosphogluconate dehydrogenase